MNLAIAGVSIASNVDDRVIVMCDEEDVIDLARRIHRRIDYAPVLGVDIVRDVRTRELYVLELNSNGWTGTCLPIKASITKRSTD